MSVCLCVRACATWLASGRQTWRLNSHAAQLAPNSTCKVLERIENIVHAEALLAQCLNLNPTFSPPPAHFEADHRSDTVRAGKKKASRSAFFVITLTRVCQLA